MIAYHGSPASQGFSSAFWSTHSGATLGASLSEPWFARQWWPCRDALDDKFTSEVWITVPSGNIAVSNGTLAGTDALTGSRVRYRWQENYPIATYLVSVAATNYATWSESYVHANGTMPLVFFSYPESKTTMQASVTDVLPAL